MNYTGHENSYFKLFYAGVDPERGVVLIRSVSHNASYFTPGLWELDYSVSF